MANFTTESNTYCFRIGPAFLDTWPGKSFFMLFGCPRWNINHSSENLKVMYMKCCMFYAIISYQFKTSELKNA